MAYCKNCGAYIPDGQTKCLACGVDEAEQTAQAAQTETKTGKTNGTTSEQMREQLERQREKQRENSRKWAEAESARRRQSTGASRSDDADDDDEDSAPAARSSRDNTKLFSALSYLGILWILPYIFCRDNRFAMYHAKQGLILCIASVVCRAVGGVFDLGWVVTLAWAYMVFTGISNANAGRMKPLPYIGKLLK